MITDHFLVPCRFLRLFLVTSATQRQNGLVSTEIPNVNVDNGCVFSLQFTRLRRA